MIKCLVIDDEQHAIDVLEHYINQLPGLQLVGTTINPLEGLSLVSSEKADLVFLDIHMPELSGIDFVKAIKGNAKVIITTAYSEFALEGFDLDVIDYLLKPIRMPRFLQAVQKAVHVIELSRSERPMVSSEEDFLFVKTELKGKLLKINLSDIDYIEGMKNYVAIHQGKQKTLVNISMKELEERLPSKNFLRVHKSFIIPIFKITGIEGNLLRLKNVASEVLVGDSYKAALMEVIKNKII